MEKSDSSFARLGAYGKSSMFIVLPSFALSRSKAERTIFHGQ